MRRKKFIAVTKSLGKLKTGLLSVTQLGLSTGGFVLAVGIDYFWLTGLIPSTLIVAALILPLVFLLGDRPDRFLKQLLAKPKKWSRGFEPARPLLKPNRTRQ
ncbi:MAG: hypothetical protein ACFBSE_13815 [Prochloraceae cyanobacterium]